MQSIPTSFSNVVLLHLLHNVLVYHFNQNDKHRFGYNMLLHLHRIFNAILYFLKILIEHNNTDSKEIKFKLVQ